MKKKKKKKNVNLLWPQSPVVPSLLFCSNLCAVRLFVVRTQPAPEQKAIACHGMLLASEPAEPQEAIKSRAKGCMIC